MTRKQRAIADAISWRAVRPADIATWSRNGRRVTYRHRWRPDLDSQVWARIHDAARRQAAALAVQSGRSIDIFTYDETRCDRVLPPAR